MAAFNKFEDFVQQLGQGTHQLQAAGHTLKVYLSNATPASTHAVKADVAEISTGNGYAGGGTDVQNDYTETGGVGTLVGTDVTFTASGGAIGPFRYVVLYNDSAASDELVGWWDYGSTVTLSDTESFTVDFSSAILTIT